MPKENSESVMMGDAALTAMTLLVLMSENERPFAFTFEPSKTSAPKRYFCAFAE